jgi:hypothetical protein
LDIIDIDLLWIYYLHFFILLAAAAEEVASENPRLGKTVIFKTVF